MEHRREFIENCQYGKQIGKILDINKMQKRAQAPKPIFLGLESEKYENMIHFFDFLKNILNLLMTFLCRMDHTLCQTSSRGSQLKQRRFGWKFKNTAKCSHNLNGALIFQIENN